MFLFAKEGFVPHWWISDMKKISIEEVRGKLYALHDDAISDLYLEAAYCLLPSESENFLLRYLGQSIGRNYPEDAEFSGSIDVNILSDNSATVIDFKFGSREVEVECMQLRNLAVLVARAENLDRVTVSIAQFDKANGMSLPDKLPSKTYNADELALARKDLDATINNIREARRLVVLGDTPKVNPGDWCKWCDCTGCENYQGK
jgi:PD-(D/E)XK nuclease superfamily